MGDALDFELLTVLSSAVSSLTANKITTTGIPRQKVMLTANYGDISFRYDGSDPTATDGMFLLEGGTVKLTGINNLKQLRMLSISGTSKVAVSYEMPAGGY